jgi:DNA-binding MarR family transcriptional regulator
MLKTMATNTNRAEREQRAEPMRSHYLKAVMLVERLHRRLLDVIKDEFDRRGRTDVNAIQASLLYNIGEQELSASELYSRGYYLGSNVSYNLKKLTEVGFLENQRSSFDRRSVRIKLTSKGREVWNIVDALYQKHVRTVEQVGGLPF